MKLSLSKAAEVMHGCLVGADAHFKSVSTDSRSITAGDLFFAIRGDNFNGEAFVERSFESGASAAVLTRHQVDLIQPQIIVDDVIEALGRIAHYRRNLLDAKVVAITGSCGKTSTKGMLKHILERVGKTHATHANFNNHIGVPLTLLSCPDDTEFVVVEAGTSARGEISYLTKIIDPDVAVVVNVHSSHMQGFGSLDAIAEEKSEIYSAGERKSSAVINTSLLKYSCFEQKPNADARVFFDHITGSNNKLPSLLLRSSNIKLSNSGFASFELRIGDDTKNMVDVELSVAGEHQIENALAAAGCAHSLGISTERIASGLQAYCGDNRRMQSHSLGKLTLIDDSYNANPASMRAAIDLVSKRNKSMLILGDMGELGVNAEQIHRAVGEYAREKGVDHFVCKGVFANDYCDGFGASAKKFTSYADIVNYLEEFSSEEMTILVKGSRYTRMDEVCTNLLSQWGEC